MPFSSVEEKDETIIENHNKLVKPNDIWYHLGDVFMGNKSNVHYLKRMNGHKRLIIGNHDDPKNLELMNYYDKAMIWRMMPEFGILMTHVPVHLGEIEDPHADSRKAKYSKNIHGHLHLNVVQKFDKYSKSMIPDDRYVNVCMEKINFTPKNICELRAK